MADLYDVARFIHIIGAAGWFGAVLIMVTRVGPAFKDAGPAAGPVVVALIKRGGLGSIIGPFAILALVGGLFMYLDGPWKSQAMQDATNILLSIGVLTGLSAFGMGFGMVLPNEHKMKKIVAGLTGPPTPEQAGQLRDLGMKNAALSSRILVLLSVTIVAMVGRVLL